MIKVLKFMLDNSSGNWEDDLDYIANLVNILRECGCSTEEILSMFAELEPGENK